MSRIGFEDVAVVIGMTMLAVGVGLVFGVGWCLIVMGGLTVGLTVLGTLRGSG